MKQSRLRFLSAVPVVVALALAVAACDDDDDPPAQPPPPAVLSATGDLEFFCDLVALECEYEGEAINDGPGCATNVRGVTRLLDPMGAELDSDEWALDPARTIVSAESFLYHDCCFSIGDKENMGSYQTDIFWDDVRCP